MKLDDIYKIYPRKEGKSIGLKKLSKILKTDADILRCHQAAQNYAKLCELEGRDRQYIKHFSSFANCWEDYESAEDLGLEKIQPKDAVVLRVVKAEDL